MTHRSVTRDAVGVTATLVTFQVEIAAIACDSLFSREYEEEEVRRRSVVVLESFVCFGCQPCVSVVNRRWVSEVSVVTLEAVFSTPACGALHILLLLLLLLLRGGGGGGGGGVSVVVEWRLLASWMAGWLLPLWLVLKPEHVL
ncbi:hypothetical protein RB195_026559 [Necator americanus]|uniref:Uncharacterized protein n=1 Tax=Necator americanus TaxID=51031 RepID=A0ABR1EXK3_NECAM